jgi:hypothetical protein
VTEFKNGYFCIPIVLYMKIRFFALLVFAAVLPVMNSCRKDHYKVSTSSIDVKIEIRRLEKDLFSRNPEDIAAAVPELKARYGGFLQLFSYVINTGEISDPDFGEYLTSFCTDRQNNEVYEYTMKIFPDVRSLETGLATAFRHYLYYFPGSPVPGVYTCITGFNNSIITMTGDSILGISLDRYLGADCKYYPQLGIYSYLSARMTPGNIIPDCMYGWALSKWEFDSAGYATDNVLSEIIHQGKLKYFEKCMLPGESDELIFGFTPGQMKFCRNNEQQMWQYLVEHDLLFKTDQFEIRKLIGEAPFTSYFTTESPGRAAVWIGFRIIESFMMKNPDVKLIELMTMNDIQSILEKSRYRPG